MDFNSIHKYPLVRILTPLLGGIVFADFYDSMPIPIGPLIAAQLFLLLILLLLHLSNASFKLRWIFGSTLMLLLFLLGVTRTLLEKPELITSNSPASYLGIVKSDAQFTTDWQHYTVALENNREQSILLYLPTDSLCKAAFNYGDRITFYGKVNPPQAPLFDSDFDYGQYLKHKSISGVCYADTSLVYKLSRAPQSFDDWLNTQRREIYNRYLSLGLSGDELALVSALTLGLKNDLSIDLKQAYSSAGVSHVLALSGLHMGLLFFVICFLLKRFVRFFHLKGGWAMALTVLLLWLFVLFVGASPSVVRSALLYSLLGVSILFSRRGNRLNSLAFVAFVMLLFNPYWLFDIGFILSFSAILSILMFFPLISPMLKPKLLVTQYFWGILVVSFVAQIGTLPWILYYFESFSLYFLLANLLIIPLITILLYLLVIYVSLLWVPILSMILTTLVVWLATLINAIVIFIRNLPYASITDVCIYPSELFFVFILILALYTLLRTSQVRYLYCFLVSILLLFLVYGVEAYRHYPSKSLKLISMGNTCFIECVEDGGKLHLVAPYAADLMPKIISMNHRRWLFKGYDTPEVVDKSTQSSALIYEDGVLFFEDVTVMLGGEYVKQNELVDSTNQFPLNYLILDKKSFNKLDLLLDNYKFYTILATFNPTTNQNKLLKEVCLANNMNYIVLEGKAYVEFLP